MLAGLPDGCAALLHFDPPWQYFTGTTGHGAAGKHYKQSPEAEIAALLASAYRVGAPDSYLAVWCTFPKLIEWAREDRILLDAGWAYISGGAWGKTGGLGVGYHFRGDAEILLLKYSEDWSYRQMAEHLGMSESAVEARLHRARQKLRSELRRIDPGLNK